MGNITFFWKTIAIEAIILIVGGLLAIFTDGSWQSIGCSIVASAIVSAVTTVFLDHQKEDPLKKWGITKVYDTRANKNNDSAKELDNLKYQLDGIAFGLKSFRNKQKSRIENCLRRGVNIRFLVMHPNSPYVE